MLTSILSILFGFILLAISGESLVNGSVKIARHFSLSEILVSAVIIGFGTSLPEMTVSVNAALHDATDMAVSNVIGSNIANMFLITAVAAIITPIVVNTKEIKDDAFFMVFATFTLLVLNFILIINLPIGALMIAAMMCYIFFSYKSEMKHKDRKHTKEDIKKLIFAFFLCGIGLIGLVISSTLLVEGALKLSALLGIGEVIIGLTVVAIGSSLPEFALAVVASYRKNSDIIIGNILGSNTFNLMAILGVTGMVKPIRFEANILLPDILILVAITLVFTALLFVKKRISRIQGVLMLLTYLIYIGSLGLR